MKKQKKRGAFFLFFLPQILKRRTSALLPITPKLTHQKYYKTNVMSEKYTEVYVLKITKTQKKTLEKLKDRNIKVANFVRQAIKEKINRDAKELKPKDKKEYCPF